MILQLIYFIVCHGVGPADHLATISEHLEKDGYEVQFYASGQALKRLQARNIPRVTAFDAETLSEETVEHLAKECSNGDVIVTDMGHAFDELLLKSLSERGLNPIGYYDNGEAYIPGGYSTATAKAIRYASKVLFANANLANAPIYESPGREIDFPFSKRIGLGYYPLEQAQKIADRRSCEHRAMRLQFLFDNNILDQGQKILVYFGGNNTEYFDKAFPSFLTFLSGSIELADLSNVMIVLQQHPGAKSKNVDGKMLQGWVENNPCTRAPKMIFSNMSSEDMLIIAEGVLYHQTSMGPLFAWAGIPTVQVGHAVNEDVLVRGGFCSVAADVQEFVHIISKMEDKPVTSERKKIILGSLGINEDWYQIFKRSILSIYF